MAPASVAGSEGREGDRNSHGARDVASTEEEHRIRVGSDPSFETGYRTRSRHDRRVAESDRRQETVHRSEERSSEVVTLTDIRSPQANFPPSPKRSSSLPPSPSQIRRWYDTRPHARRCPDGSDERLRVSDSAGLPADGMDPEIAVLPSGRQTRRSGVRPLQPHAHAGPLHRPRGGVLASRQPRDVVGRRRGAAGRDRRPGWTRVHAAANPATHAKNLVRGLEGPPPHSPRLTEHQRTTPPS